METAEKEAQDTSCWGSGGVPQLKKSPKIGGYRGLTKSISAFYIIKQEMLKRIQHDTRGRQGFDERKQDMRKIPRLTLSMILLLVAALIVTALPIVAQAQQPPQTANMLTWGNVTLDGAAAQIGTTVEVFIGADATPSGSRDVFAAGEYGGIVVSSLDTRFGEDLTYKVNGIVATKRGPDEGVFGVKNQVVNLEAFSGSPSPDDSGGLSGGAVAGIVGGVLLAVALIAWLKMRRQKGSGNASETPESV